MCNGESVSCAVTFIHLLLVKRVIQNIFAQFKHVKIIVLILKCIQVPPTFVLQFLIKNSGACNYVYVTTYKGREQG